MTATKKLIDVYQIIPVAQNCRNYRTYTHVVEHGQSVDLASLCMQSSDGQVWEPRAMLTVEVPSDWRIIDGELSTADKVVIEVRRDLAGKVWAQIGDPNDGNQPWLKVTARRDIAPQECLSA